MARIPLPGRPVRGSQTGRPIMALLDLLGRRWCLRVLWELRQEPLSFRALQAACGEISPTVLNTRLAELRQTGLVELRERAGYTLTPRGRELMRILRGLGRFADGWAGELDAAPATD